MSLKPTVKHLFILTLLLVVGSFVFNTSTASADVTLTPNPGPLPGSVRNYMENADTLPFSPAFTSWLSRAGAPSVTSWSVPYGAASVGLDFHWAGVVGYRPSSTVQSRLRIVSVAPSVGTPGGAILGIGAGNGFTLTFAPNQNVPGTFRQALRGFQYRPTGGFTSEGPRDYTLVVRYQAINQFQAGNFSCIATGEPTNGWDFADCSVSAVAVTVRLTVLPQPVDAGSCTVSAPGTIDPNTTFSASFTANNTGDFNWPVNNGTPIRYRLRDPSAGGWPGIQDIEILGPGVTPTGFGPILQPNRSTTWTRNFTSPPTAGRYTFSWRIYGSNDGSAGGLHFVGATCSQTITVVDRPYFRAYGDVSAGAGFFAGNVCTADVTAFIAAYNRDTNPYTGAGTQTAVFALGAINQFASGQIRAPATPNYLSFANGGTYGGNLANTTDNRACAPDYFANRTGVNPGGTIHLDSNTDGDFSQTGDLIVRANAPIGAGNRVTIYVDGNAFIKNNIDFPGGAYANAADVPSFRLIVRGNIYVEHGVERLSGIYVAQPESGNTNSGRFYTCGSVDWLAGHNPPYVPTEDELADECRQNKLTVYGGVVAEILKLLRTPGSARQSTTGERYNTNNPAVGNPAEVFIMTPEAWINGGLNTGDGESDSVTPLPPIL